jgi:hypothetical protein
MKRPIVALVAIAMGVCTASAEKDITTCDQFRERLAKAEKLFGTYVPRFEFGDLDPAGDIEASDDRAYEIENVRGLTGELACNRRTGKLSSLQVNAYVFDAGDDKDRFNTSDRFMVSMFAVTWAYTNWSKSRVQAAVKKMISDAHAELERSERRGDRTATGNGTIDINHNVNVTYTIGSLGVGYMIQASIGSAKSAER